MDINDILLKNEEIYVGDGHEKPRLFVPIHPALMRKDIEIDKHLVYETLQKTIEPWQKDVSKYYKIDNKNKNDIINKIVGKNTKVKRLKSPRDGEFVIESCTMHLQNFGFMDNGLVRTFQVGSENCLYLDRDHSLSMQEDQVTFTPEKFYEYSCKKDEDTLGSKSATCHAYQVHNIGNYIAALFLRDWAVIYLNTALEQVLK